MLTVFLVESADLDITPTSLFILCKERVLVLVGAAWVWANLLLRSGTTFDVGGSGLTAIGDGDVDRPILRLALGDMDRKLLLDRLPPALATLRLLATDPVGDAGRTGVVAEGDVNKGRGGRTGVVESVVSLEGTTCRLGVLCILFRRGNSATSFWGSVFSSALGNT